MRKFLTLIAVLALLAVIWVVVQRTYQMPGAGTTGTARTVFETSMQKGYPDIVQAVLAAGARDANAQHIDASRIDSAAVVQLAAQQGFQRLDDPTLISIVRLRSDFVDHADPEACAEMWSGGNNDVLVRAIETLPDDQQRQWAQLFDQAAIATIKNQPAMPAPPADQFNAAMGRLISTMSPTDQAAVETMATSNSGNETAEQKCNAVRLFYGGLEKVSSADALTITRYMQYH
ncbi:MAG: hypothetical protein WBY93_03980 [Candidatus Binatus sp.]